jgi:hypothetical protein
MQQDIVPKGTFAAMLGVGASAVSQMIATGRLSGAALVGEGCRSRINVSIAKEQLRNGLDGVAPNVRRRLGPPNRNPGPDFERPSRIGLKKQGDNSSN